MAIASSRRRMLLAALGAVVLFAAIYLVVGVSSEEWVDEPTEKAESASWRTSVSLAGSAVTFLATALSIGPLRVLRGGRPTVHLPWRRTFGVGGALFASGHLVVALTIHGSVLRPWHQFFRSRPTLSDPFTVLSSTRGLANWVGLGVATTLLVLAVLSRESWLRRLGATRWKTAQRAIYVAFGAIAAHAILYWRVEERLLPHQIIVLVPIITAAGLQASASVSLLARRRRNRPHLLDLPAD